ncbi:PilN domain-containing protein [Providencia sp. PROV137]|uniref:PilN domain-containing protein n=1 Tax=Providencia sp. PROV137 TaxID=2949847 RepID=UPI002349CF3D|nr:PilN domain-containing protein [Providencia sp. PROV137]
MGLSKLYQVNFLPWRQQQIVKKQRLFIIFSLVAGCSVLITCCFLVFFHQLEIEKQQKIKYHHQQQYEQTQQLAQRVSLQKKQLLELISQKNRLDEVMNNNQFLLKLLQDLPLITPLKSWLTTVQLVDNKIEIKARSYDFQNVSLLSPKLKERGLNHIQLKKLSRTNQVHRLHLTAIRQGEANE